MPARPASESPRWLVSSEVRALVTMANGTTICALDVGLTYEHHKDCTPTHGYEPTREAAMAAFAKTWRRE